VIDGIARIALVVACAVLVAACGSTSTPRQGQSAPPTAVATTPATQAPAKEAAAGEAGPASARDPTPRNLPAIAVPAGALYVCVTGAGGTLRQAPIDLEPKLAALCRKHPEMGPCQYERETCRQSGGRVFAANGMEITAVTEAEYDRKVKRIRFRSN
jgi:hypothetical protein